MRIRVDEVALSARIAAAETSHTTAPTTDGLRHLCRLYFMGIQLGAAYQESGAKHAAAGVAAYTAQPLFEVYGVAFALGAAYYLPTPLMQYQQANAALHKLDALHARYPRLLEVRYVHTAATYGMPAIMGRIGAAQAEVLTLIRDAVKGFDDTDTLLVADVLDFLLLTGLAARSQQHALQAQREALMP